MSTVAAIKIEPIRLRGIDAAKFLGFSQRKLQQLVEKKLIRYVTDPGGVRMYPVAELRRYQEKLEQEQWQ